MRSYVLAVSLLITISAACSTSSSNTSARAEALAERATPSQSPEMPVNSNAATSPSPADDDSSLAEDLVGTWKHVSIAKTPDGAREPLKHSSISWTFDADGSGSYVQTIRGIARGSGKNEFNWKINGDDIEISPTGRGRAVSYTVVKSAENEMTWRNETLGDYYIVERQ